MKRKSGSYRVFGDMSFTLFIVVTAVLFLLLPIVSEAVKTSTSETEGLKPQGNIIVELYWPDEMNTDVDLWVKSDADDIPVGYSNKGGPVFNLLRDDLGTLGDISEKNYEVSYSRGVPDGEYIVNTHLFALKGGKLPVPVTVIISLRLNENAATIQLFKVNTTLTKDGEERTLARFTIYDGKYVSGSFNTLQEPLRLKDPNK